VAGKSYNAIRTPTSLKSLKLVAVQPHNIRRNIEFLLANIFPVDFPAAIQVATAEIQIADNPIYLKNLPVIVTY
jgi:hypothetical protein